MRSFFDTNVLVYADDGDNPQRQAVAVQLVQHHMLTGSAVLSTQVLQEFVNAALRKLHLPVDLVRARLALYSRMQVVPASADLVAQALNVHVLHGTSFWDALIVQAARQSGCVQLFTEGMAAGATLAGVRVVNPFSAATPVGPA